VSPRRSSVFSFTPVQATAAPKSSTTEVPCVPRKRESRPAITSAAMRACRFAGPASAIRLHSPVTKSRTSTASPTAKMSGSLVRICSSTRIPPRFPISIPAIVASAVSGRTPSARITRSAG